MVGQHKTYDDPDKLQQLYGRRTRHNSKHFGIDGKVRSILNTYTGNLRW